MTAFQGEVWRQKKKNTDSKLCWGIWVLNPGSSGSLLSLPLAIDNCVDRALIPLGFRSSLIQRVEED